VTSFCCLSLLTVLFCVCLFDPPFFVLVHSWVVMSGVHGSPNISLFCTSTPTHRPNSEYSQRQTPCGCTTTRPAILLQVLIFHFNKETSISLGETGAASPPQSPLGDHTSLGFPTSRHAHPSPPFYVMFCFKLTYRVSPYLERSLLCLLDLSSIVKADLQGYATTVGTSISGVGKVPVSLEVLLLCCMRLCVSV